MFLLILKIQVTNPLLFMKIKAYLLTVFLIFITSLISALLLLFYMDPETNKLIAIITMGLACFLASGSLLSLLIYFFKKIYYRGEVYVHTVNSSLRQGIFLALG